MPHGAPKDASWTPPAGGVLVSATANLCALLSEKRAMCRLKLVLSVCLFACASVAAAETLEGHVTGIVDGDTLMVDVPNRGQLRVRLAWIDAPDRLQEHGEASRSGLNALAAGQGVRVETVAEAKGLQVAVVWVKAPDAPCRDAGCPKTLDLGLAQVARGLAWHDRRPLGQSPQAKGQYEHAEFEAKIRRVGLWSGKNPTPPWDWRGR